MKPRTQEELDAWEELNALSEQHPWDEQQRAAYFSALDRVDTEFAKVLGLSLEEYRRRANVGARMADDHDRQKPKWERDARTGARDDYFPHRK